VRERGIIPTTGGDDGGNALGNTLALVTVGHAAQGGPSSRARCRRPATCRGEILV